MIDHNTQETLLLDLSKTLFREYRGQLKKNAEHAETQRTPRLCRELNPTPPGRLTHPE